jgi:hypothetical protein
MGIPLRFDRQPPPTPAWINDGEKFGLVGLSVKLHGDIAPGMLTRRFWILTDTTFTISPLWREWLGSIRTGEVEDRNLFLKLTDAVNRLCPSSMATCGSLMTGR